MSDAERNVMDSTSAEYGSLVTMAAQPEIGAWYRSRGGESFEVVAIDEDDGTIEMPSLDGTVEEMEIKDWDTQRASGEIENAEAPEDWSGSGGGDSEEDEPAPNRGP